MTKRLFVDMFPQTDDFLICFRKQGKRSKSVDMFPYTDDINLIATRHVETCVLLVRECAHDDEMVSIKVDLEGISLDQGKFEPAEKPTYGNIKKWIKEKYGFNVKVSNRKEE